MLANANGSIPEPSPHSAASVVAVAPIPPPLVMPMTIVAPVLRFVVGRRGSVVHRRRSVIRWRRGAVVHARGRLIVNGRGRRVDGGWRFVIQRRADADGPIYFGVGRRSSQ